jgi:hypothetical protein
MGMTASQARFLTLTARKNNIEFEIQQTTQAKMLLALQQENAALAWSNGMNIQHLYYSKDGTGGVTRDMPRLTYQLVTNKDIIGFEMRVKDKYDRQVVMELPGDFDESKDIADYLVDPYAGQAEYFEDRIKSGEWILEHPSAWSQTGWTEIGAAGSTFIYQGADSKDFRIAEAEYSSQMTRLEGIDKRFDMRIQMLSNEQKAIQTEMESVKKVIDKNIDETFKSFA